MISRIGTGETILVQSDEEPITLSEKAGLMKAATTAKEAVRTTLQAKRPLRTSKEQASERKLEYSTIYDRISPGRKLSPAEEAELRELKRVDNAVRAHERQHFFAAGAYAMGGPQFHYKTGPDGKRYAYIGHVDMEMSVDFSDPEKALRKAEIIKKAAMAPLDPSPADMAIAAMAQAALLRAKGECQARKARKAYHRSIEAKFQEKALAARNRLMFCQSFQSRLQSNQNS